MTRKRRFLIDGSALVYRAHFAFGKNPLLNSRGENTSAVFGYINTLLSLLERESPEEIAVVFDTSAPNFRHALFAEYKATREKMPEELAEQLPVIRHLTSNLGIKVLHQSGVEADDIIGTLAKRGEAEGVDVLIISGDKDFAQLVTEHIHIYDPGRGGKNGKDPERIDPAQVLEKYGVRPDQIIDYMALLGDSSDNVPGVKGIGEVTAKKLIAEYQTLDNLYAHLPELSASVRTKLHDKKDMAYLSRDLVTIRNDVEIHTDTSDLSRGPVDAKELHRHFSDLEFHNLLKRIPQIAKHDTTLPSSTPLTTAQGQYRLIRDLDGLSEAIHTCKEAGQLFFHLLLEYDEIRPHYFAFALSHGTQEAWIAIPTHQHTPATLPPPPSLKCPCSKSPNPPKRQPTLRSQHPRVRQSQHPFPPHQPSPPQARPPHKIMLLPISHSLQMRLRSKRPNRPNLRSPPQKPPPQKSPRQKSPPQKPPPQKPPPQKPPPNLR